MIKKIFYILIFTILINILTINNVMAYGLVFTGGNDCRLEGNGIATYFKLTTGKIENKKTSNYKKIVYCYDEDDSFPTTTSKKKINWNTCYEKSDTAEETVKLKYVIANGFNTSKFNENTYNSENCNNCYNKVSTFVSDKNDNCYNYSQYFRTQKAVWTFSQSSHSTEEYDNQLIKDANNYYEKYKEYVLTTPTKEISLNTNNEYMNVDGNYYKSNLITIDSNSSNLLNENLEIDVQELGDEIIEKVSKDKFYVKIPISSTTNKKEITVKVSYKYKKYTGKLFLCTTKTSGVQRLVDYSPSEENEEISKTLKLKIGYRCTSATPSNNQSELSCNISKNYSSKCDHLTINKINYSYKNKKYNIIADIILNQNGTISSVLTPQKTYSGGGFKFNIIYNNNISWNYYNSSNSAKKCIELSNSNKNCSDEITNDIIEDILLKNEKNRIKKYENFQNSISIESIKFGKKNFEESSFIKKCYGNNEFKEKQMNSTCIFTLPEAVVDKYTGNISSYNNDSSKLNINNKHYTPLSYVGDYGIEVQMNGLSRINESTAKDDSTNTTKSWNGNWWNEKFSCKIKLTPLLYQTPSSTGKAKYKFIYRPIDIYNPFPNRNPGFNWYDWYPKNKEELEKTYSKLQYSVNLNNNNINRIKQYNKSNNYLKWDFDGDESKFINNNKSIFNKLRENVGDNS